MRHSGVIFHNVMLFYCQGTVHPPLLGLVEGVKIIRIAKVAECVEQARDGIGRKDFMIAQHTCYVVCQRKEKDDGRCDQGQKISVLG